MLVSDVVNIIQEQTRDEKITWTDDDVLQYVNEAIKSVVERAPESSSKNILVDCVSGVDQVLPDEAVQLINIIANDVDINNKPGLIIHEVDVTQKDAYSPAWRQTAASSVVIEWMKRSMPTEFMVWPPLESDRKLLVEYSYYPAELTSIAQTIALRNGYEQPIISWSLYRTYGRDAEDTPSVKRSEGFLAQFEAFFV